jgi:hypothetical protein
MKGRLMIGEAWFMEDGKVQDLPGAITIPVNLWPEYKAILDNLSLLQVGGKHEQAKSREKRQPKKT